jgi:branched-chain amino acid transport system substrate-binding protein
MLPKRLVFLILSLLVVASLALTACQPAPPPTPAEEEATPEEEAAPPEEGEATPEEEASPPEGEPIIIGAVFNATGWMAAYDQPPRSAALLAIEEINSQGGVLGRPLELIELDGKTDPATVGNAARQLIEQGADVILAPCDFDIGAPASQAAQEAGLVGLSTCATSPLYGSEALGDKQFTTGMWNNIMGSAMAEYGYKELGWRTAYIVVDTSIDYTLSLGEYFGESFTAMGGEVVGEDTYVAGDEDFSAQIQRIQALPEEPDVLYITGVMPDLGTVLRQVRAAGIETPMAGGDTYDDTALFELLGPELGNNLYMATHSWLGPESGPAMEHFIELYEAEYGEPPVSAFIVMGWDAVMVLAQAIEKAGTTDGAAVAKAMEDTEFDLLSGKLDWTTAAEGHETLKSAAIVQVQGGKPSFLAWYRPESPPEP